MVIVLIQKILITKRVRRFLIWYANIYVKIKVLIAGNHDWWALKNIKDKVKDYGIIYLEDEEEFIDGKLIYGSPWTPNFNDWFLRKTDLN